MHTPRRAWAYITILLTYPFQARGQRLGNTTWEIEDSQTELCLFANSPSTPWQMGRGKDTKTLAEDPVVDGDLLACYLHWQKCETVVTKVW